MAQTNINIQMRLISANEVSFMMSPGKVDENVAPEAMQIGFSSQIKPNNEKNRITIIFGTKYVIAGEVALESVYSFIFEVKDLSQFLTINDDQSITVSHIMPHFLSVAVGTMRGILVVKTAGTNLSKFPLPMVDVNTLLNNLSMQKSEN